MQGTHLLRYPACAQTASPPSCAAAASSLTRLATGPNHAFCWLGQAEENADGGARPEEFPGAVRWFLGDIQLRG